MVFQPPPKPSLMSGSGPLARETGLPRCAPRGGAARAFYRTPAAAAVIDVAVSLSPIDPVRALYWSAVINGIMAVPVMVVMMTMVVQARVMGRIAIKGWLRWLSWASTIAMMACVAGIAIGLVS